MPRQHLSRLEKGSGDRQSAPDDIAIAGTAFQLGGMAPNRVGETVAILQRNGIADPGLDNAVIQFVAILGEFAVLELTLQENVVESGLQREARPEKMLGNLAVLVRVRLFAIAGQFRIERNPGRMNVSGS